MYHNTVFLFEDFLYEVFCLCVYMCMPLRRVRAPGARVIGELLGVGVGK